MRLYFKNYDNGWKYLKMIGGCAAVVCAIRLLKYSMYANQYRVSLLEIMGGEYYDFVILAVGLLAYIIGKWMNYSVEITEMLRVKKYSEVDAKLEERKEELFHKIEDEAEKNKFLEVYGSLQSKMEKATYLVRVGCEVEKPQWMS